jgi:hypothetical protein
MASGRIHHQQGIALGPILFIIAIIAVLAVAIAAGSGGFNVSTSNDSAKVMASVILQESEQVQSAVQELMANGCLETQLNFAPITTNPTAPTDGHCNVFDPRGGAMLYVPPPTSACVTGGTCRQTASDGSAIPGIGTGAAQPLWVTYYLTPAVCNQINAQLGRTTNPIASGVGDYGYDGTFPVSQTLGVTYTGISAACIMSSTVGWQFYRVLWTR